MTLRRKTKRRTTRPAPAYRLEDSRQEVLGRALYRCEAGLVCRDDGVELYGRPYSVHHRRPRAMGGTRREDTDSPANLLAVCGTGTTGCHGWIESHRAIALDRGLLLAQSADPATEPVLRRGEAVYLNHDGTFDLVADSPERKHA